jgi:predicted ABC-type ATPase
VKPVLLVIAGPHGAGKTTVTVQLRQDRWSHGVEYLNPDDIAQQRFGDWNSADAVLKAAQWTSARREELLAEGAGIAFETVFSTADKIGFVRRARKQGYFVRVFFVGTSDPRINAGRIAGRVMVALRVADRVYIYDNSVDAVQARLCARAYEGQLRKIYGPLPDWVADAIADLPRHPDFVDLR